MKKLSFTTPRELVQFINTSPECQALKYSSFFDFVMNPTRHNAAALKSRPNGVSVLEAEILNRILSLKEWDKLAEIFIAKREHNDAVVKNIKRGVRTLESVLALMSKANRERLEGFLQKGPNSETPIEWTLESIRELSNKSVKSFQGGDDFTGEDLTELVRLCSYGVSAWFNGVNSQKKNAFIFFAQTLSNLVEQVQTLNFKESERDVLKTALQSNGRAVSDCLHKLKSLNSGAESARRIKTDLINHLHHDAGKKTFNPDLVIAFYIGLSSIYYADALSINGKDNAANKKTLKELEILIEGATVLSAKLNK